MKITHNSNNKWQDELRLMDLSGLIPWVEALLKDEKVVPKPPVLSGLQKRMKTLEIMFEPEYLHKIFKHIENTYDALFRLNGGQLDYFLMHMNDEMKRTQRFTNMMQLANDTFGYDCCRVLAVLTHPCQLCAEDPEAWHTRAAFCNHKK